MHTTVGFFYAESHPTGCLIRAGKTELPLTLEGEYLGAMLPFLLRNAGAARSLTEPATYPTLLEAMLSQGWQEANFIFAGGGWYELTDMLGSRGERLAGPREPAAAATALTTEKQLTAIANMTSSHVFDRDRLVIRKSLEAATAGEASLILDFVKAEIALRPRLYPRGQREAYLRTQR